MKFKTKKDMKHSELNGFENYGEIPKGEICEVMFFERFPAIFYNGKAVCDPDSQMAKDYFEQID